MTYRLYRHTNPSRFRRVALALVAMAFGVPAATMSLAIAEQNQPAPNTIPNAIIINEIKSGGTNTQPSQYVTLFNTGAEAVSLAGWRIEYAKPTFSSQHCASANWDEVGLTAVNTATPTMTIAAMSVSQPIEIAINDNDAGSIHISDPQGTIHDTVGWGNAESKAPCFETEQAVMLSATKSLIRYLGCSLTHPTDADDNALDFMLTDSPVASQTGSQASPQCAPSPPAPGPDLPDPTPPQPATDSCNSIVLSELLSNPAGSDSGREFIEIHNPTDSAVVLDSCSLQTSASTSARYDLTGLKLAPLEYRAFSDTESDLVLPNSSGGTVWLTNATDELSSVTYPANIDDDVSWSLLRSQWVISYSPSPGDINVDMPAKPCEDGMVRSIESNRCVKPPEQATAAATASAAAQAVTSCKPGQERNPATNRCRAITGVAAGSTPTACKAGQERNPETNRCRNIATTAAGAKTCPQGQERNPDTNRCRKVNAAAAGASATVIDDNTPSGGSSSNRTWIVIGLAVLLSVGYSIYEWRQEIVLWLKRRLGKLQPNPAIPRA